jgi:hypothetical protein
MQSGVTNGPVNKEGVLAYIKEHRMPICFGGGEYIIGDVGEAPRCSIHRTVTNRYYPYWWRRREIEPEN